jgi:hypothetical protein
VSVHVIGFAKLVGDLIDGLIQVALYFLHGRADRRADHLRSTRAACAARRWSSPARWSRCVWQLGHCRALGFELDPYSILVPFLVFAIGVSHGAQKMNGIMQDIGRGAHRWSPRASRSGACSSRPHGAAGRRSRLRGADGDRHPVIKDLALTASVGVAVLISPT